MIYKGNGSSCPQEEKSFTGKIEFQEKSHSTIVTKVEYALNAIDSQTGNFLFNATKIEYLPHFNRVTKGAYLSYLEFLKGQSSGKVSVKTFSH